MIEAASVVELKKQQTRLLKRRRIEAELSDEDLRRLGADAQSAGVDRATYAGALLRRALDDNSVNQHPHAGMTFAEILAPVHKEFAESGMTEEELYQFLEEVREEVWQEKQRKKSGP